jgi:hypothetical protein
MPPRADLMPRRFSSMAMDPSVIAPVVRMTSRTGSRPRCEFICRAGQGRPTKRARVIKVAWVTEGCSSCLLAASADFARSAISRRSFSASAA